MREGGSIPVVGLIKQHLGVDTLLLGWGQNDDNLHGPNEKFSIADFHRGIKAAAHLLAELADGVGVERLTSRRPDRSTARGSIGSGLRAPGRTTRPRHHGRFRARSEGTIMLDLKYVVANAEAVKQNCRNRNAPPDVLDDVDRVVALEARAPGLLQAVEEVRRRQNEVAQATGRERDAAKRTALIDEGKRLKSEVAEEEERLRRLEAELNQRLKRIPNLTHPDAPIGLTEDESRELRKVGTPRAFDFKPKDHVELGKDLDLIDFETGGKVSGTGFYFLKNDAVLLDLALQQFAVRKLVAAGFTPIITPDLARNSILEGIGFTPRGASRRRSTRSRTPT